ncbi:hypothetical protein AN958_12569, partial [Leucoagaricus sp. SymC.cos]
PEKAVTGHVPPYIMDFTPDTIPSGWTRFLHPQGSLYFHHKEKSVLTNTNILDEDNRNIITETMNQIFRKLEYDNVEIPSDTQLVIDVRWDKQIIGYYFATLQGRCLFWAQEKCLEPLYKRVTRVWSHSHMLGHLIEAELWVHYQHFPHVQVLPPQILRELKGFLLYTATDQIFNANTTSEYSIEEVDKALSIINSIPPDFISNERSSAHEIGYYLCIVAYNLAASLSRKLINAAALHRFDNHHGQPNARWHRDDFLYEDSAEIPRSYFLRLTSPLLFFTPETYYQSLRNIMNDGNVFFEAWRIFVGELHQEWKELIIIATVLLAANMAFLAIPSLDNGDNPELRSPAQICSYISIVTSVCSIVLGQLFSRYHRIKGWERFDERITENYDLLLDIGCSQLAVMYSLPYAFLTWSLIIFLVAFLVMCFDKTHNDVKLSIGVLSVVILLTMAYCVYKIRDNDEQRSQKARLFRYYDRLRYLFHSYPRSSSWRGPNPDSTELHDNPNPHTPPVPQVFNV